MHGTVIVRLRYIGQLLLAPKHLLSSLYKKVPNEQKCPHPRQAPHNPSVAQALPLSFVCIFAFSPLDDHHKQPWNNTVPVRKKFTVSRLAKHTCCGFASRLQGFSCSYWSMPSFVSVPYHTKHKQPSPPALLNGPYWRFIKKLCMTQLLSSSQVAHFVHVREQEINSLLKNVMVCSNEGRVMDLSFELTALTNNILCRMAMSTSCLDRVDDAAEVLGLVREFLNAAAKLSMGEVLGPLGIKKK
ncbi:hypothetical protein JHK87_007300 [Glycine soja]|nr:hypothetical protein JHK87_007300 [Glycine soja]